MINQYKKIGVSQKAIIYDDDDRILALRRTETAPTWPLHWDLPGGELEYGEELAAAIMREIKEETGLEVSGLRLFDVHSNFEDSGAYWVTICYTARPKSEEVILSYEHDQFSWLTPDEFLKLPASPTIKRFVEKFFHRV